MIIYIYIYTYHDYTGNILREKAFTKLLEILKNFMEKPFMDCVQI